MVATTVDVNVRARWQGRDLNRGTQQVNRDLDRVRGTLQRMAPILRTVGGLMGVAVGAQMAKQVVGMADAWRGYENRIKLFTNSARETAEVQQRLFNISQRTRTQMGSTVELYQRFSIANKELGLAQAELGGILETVNQALIISGGSAESANAAVIQLGQGLASGTLRGEELNSVLEQAPRLAMAIAAGMGVPIGKLRELGAEGKITALQIIEALQSQQETVSAEYGKMEITVSGAWTKLTDAVGLYISEFDKSVGLTERLSQAMSDVADKVATAATAKKELALSQADQDMMHFFGASTTLGQGAGRGLIGRTAGGAFPLGADPFARRAGPSAEQLEVARQAMRGRGGRLGGGLNLGIGGGVEAVGFGPEGIRGARFGQGGGGRGLDLKQAIVEGFGEGLRRGFDSGGLQGLQAPGFTEKLRGPLSGGGAGTPESIALAARAASAQAESEREILEIRQKAEVQMARLNDLGGVYIKTLESTHEGELQKFDDAEMKKQLDAAIRAQAKANRAEEIDLRRRAAREQRDFNRMVQDGASILQRFAPEFGNLIGAVSRLAQGDTIGAAVQGIHGLLDVFSLATDANEEYRLELEKTRRSLQLAAQSASGFAHSMGGEVSYELLSLQNEALKPLQDLFQIIQLSAPDASIVQQTEAFFKALEIDSFGIGNLLGQNQSRSRRDIFSPDFDVANLSQELSTALLLTGTSFADFIEGLQTAFGVEGVQNLQNVGRQIFTVRDALNELGDAANDLTKPLERATTATFDIREMGIRRQAQAQFAGAGGDVHAQAQVFAQLKGSIDSLALQERTALRAVRGGGSPPTGQFGGTTGYPSDYDPPNPAAKAVSGGGGVTAGDLVKAGVPMAAVVDIVPSGLDEFGVTEYADIIDFGGELVRIEKPWAHAIKFIRSHIGYEWNLGNYDEIIDFGGELTRIKKPWAHAVKFVPSHLVDDFGVYGYDQIIAFAGDITRIEKPWHHAVGFSAGHLVDDFGVSHYDQIVTFAGDVGRIRIPWTHAVSFSDRIPLFYSQIFDIQTAPIAINIGDVVSLVGSPRKISITELVDLSELEGLVGGIVSRNTSNRRQDDRSETNRSALREQVSELAARDRELARSQQDHSQNYEEYRTDHRWDMIRA